MLKGALYKWNIKPWRKIGMEVPNRFNNLQIRTDRPFLTFTVFEFFDGYNLICLL